MLKAIFLVLVCLFGAGAVFALRPAESESATGQAVVNSGSKADRLPVGFSDDEPKKVAIEPVRIAPIDESKPEPAKRKVTSWHWHAGKKIIRK
jgi:hypothetical protein